jgi:hypothetical protein
MLGDAGRHRWRLLPVRITPEACMRRTEIVHLHCPTCQATQIIKNGSIHNGKPKRISDATKQLIDKLLLERISLVGIVRVTGVSPRWLQYYVNAKYASVPRSMTVTEQKGAPDSGM